MIVDFGSAFKTGKKNTKGSCYNNVLTKLGIPPASQIGTVGYKAPELYRDCAANKEIDLFASGIVAYTMLCGFPPFVSDPSFKNDESFEMYPFWFFFNENTQELKTQIEFGNVAFPAKFWAQVSPHAKSFIRLLLEKTPSKRLTAKDSLQHPWIYDLKTNQTRLGPHGLNFLSKVVPEPKSLISSRIAMLQESGSTTPTFEGEEKCEVFARVPSVGNNRTRLMRRMSNVESHSCKYNSLSSKFEEKENPHCGQISNSIGAFFTPGHVRTKTMSDTRSLYRKGTDPQFPMSLVPKGPSDVAPAQ